MFIPKHNIKPFPQKNQLKISFFPLQSNWSQYGRRDYVTSAIKNLSGTRQTTILFCRLQSSTVFSALCAYYHACTSSCEFGIVSARVKSRYHIIDRRCHRRPIAMNGRVITRRRDVATRLLPTYTDDVGVLAIEPALAVWWISRIIIVDSVVLNEQQI